MHLPLDDAALYVEQRGRGPDFVMLHGMGLTSARAWDFVLPTLAARHHITVYDLRGHGRSPDRSGEQSIARHTADLVAVLDHLGIAQAHVLGFSLTGFVAQLLALEHPERVRSLMLVGTSAKVPDLFHQRFAERLAIIERDGMSAYAEKQLPLVLSRRFMAEHPDVMEWYRRQYEANDPTSYGRAMRAMLQMDLRGRIGALRCPTLIISGADDGGLIRGVEPLEASNELHRLIGASELAVIPDCGHYVQIERPDEFAALVGDFVARVEQRLAGE